MRTAFFKTTCSISSLLCVMASSSPVLAEQPKKPVTPIEHVIIVVGENHTFDNLFGTYQPKAGQTVHNLLSQGIVQADGSPGPAFKKAEQKIGIDTDKYRVETASSGSYATLPQPFTTFAIAQPPATLDARFPADLPNGPYQISKFIPYSSALASFSGDPVHRFFQMWQQWDGGKFDKFVWVEETIGTGSNGAPFPPGGFNPKEGAISMGFFNMNAYVDAKGVKHAGDAPVFKSLADQFAISDNYHQSVMGGTGANFLALMTGHAAFFTDPVKLDGSPAKPFDNQIENPDPVAGTNNYYTQDGFSGGTYVHCADPAAPGVAAIDEQLKRHGVHDNRCVPGHYYLVNNYDLFWDQSSSKPRPLGRDQFTLPPQTSPTIADVMTRHGVSWKFYSGDRGDDVTNFKTSVNGLPLLFHFYCGICDPLTGFSSIMKNPSEEAKLQNYGAFLKDVSAGTLPAVSFVRPFEALAGHPADSNSDLYEKFLLDLISRVQADPKLWASTAIFITTDEGGGYYDTGYIQPIDFFGDGTRIPLIAVSPYAKKGFVDHTYYDHASLLKFIERNWRLPTVSRLSRDNLPNPEASKANPYVPENRPAIGDLMNLFTFSDRLGEREGKEE